MKILTSYYASRNLDRNRHFLVQVSNSAPAGIAVDVKLKEVIPDWNTIVKPYKDGALSAMDYTTRYQKQLNTAPFNIIMALDDIVKQAEDKDIVLLCYEKPGDFSHRHILARWLEKNAEMIQFTVAELDLRSVDELGTSQLTLF